MKFLLSILLIPFWISSHSQLKKEDVISAYIYNFANLSSSPKQSQLNTYGIIVVSNNTSLIESLQKMKAEVKINGKPIGINIDNTGKNDLKEACMVYIDKNALKDRPGIISHCIANQVLLISEGNDRKEAIMLNLYVDEGQKVKFEIHQRNIKQANITISKDILTMGGRIVDQQDQGLDANVPLTSYIEDSLNVLTSKLDENKAILDKHQQAIEEQRRNINTKEQIISDQSRKQAKLSADLSNYQKQLEVTENAYRASTQEASSYIDSLQRIKDSLFVFQSMIADNNDVLLRQQSEIKENQTILFQKEQIIKKQWAIVAFFVIGTIVTLALFFMLLKSFKDKKRKNAQLRKQKAEISKQYDIMEKNKNLIESMIDELSEKNEELLATLEDNKRIQSQMVQHEKMASLGVLSAGIAHEINNPINFVYAGINSLLRDFEDIAPVINEVHKLDPESKDLKKHVSQILELKKENYYDEAIEAIPEIIGDIKLGADRTAEIVKGLRNFTRMDQSVYEPLNINEGIDTSLLLLKNKYKEHIAITKNYCPELPELICYPGKINQALLNILANAVDAIKEHGEIIITTRNLVESIEISIRDSGDGIPEEIQSRIFDPFFTTKSVGKGTGLGLSITFGIINEHNGSIKVLSEQDKGSEFIITLPYNN